jgi:hypothetical protein
VAVQSMSLTEIVTAKLKTAFPNRQFCFADDARQPFATLPPEWEGFGAIELVDDGDEWMVHFGSFTHTHLVGAERQEIAEQVVQILQDTFADRLVFWAIGENGSGGVDQQDAEPFWSAAERPVNLRRGVWSGPLFD